MAYGKWFVHFGTDKAVLSFPSFKVTIFNEDDLHVYARSMDPPTNKIYWESTDFTTQQARHTTIPQEIPLYKQNLSKLAHWRMANILYLQWYFGLITLKNIKDFHKIRKPAISIIDAGVIPTEIGAVSTKQWTNRKVLLIQWSKYFFDVAHMDIACGDITVPGGLKHS